ncbi:ParB/RepB/Spo0J family partition protein [Desulfobacterales bacterium HSG16]|nr:ParB/RepB/Spo0J family partition protein [Desulfobacterales bacterium HSG16]
MKKSVGAKKGKGRKTALGKGLDALLPDMNDMEEERKDLFLCDINQIRANPFQPRRSFPEQELESLRQSIEEQGVLQPLLLREAGKGYELIAGERRLRAAKKAGFTQVPVFVKDVSNEQLLEMSIVENVQRENLNPVEESEAYHRLMSEFSMTQDQVAQKVGKSRSAVANFIRLRQLPDQIKDCLKDGSLSTGHARALLGAATSAQMSDIWRIVMDKELSVRQTEDLVKRLKALKKPEEKPQKEPSSEEIHINGIAETLSLRFGTKVQINRRGKKGKVTMDFYSNDDLDRLIRLLDQ